MKTDKVLARRVAKTTIGILTFAFLMGARGEFSQLWIRVLLAALAGAVFGLAMIQCQKPPRK